MIVRYLIAVVLVGGAIAYLAFGEHKEYGLLAGIVALIASRFLVLSKKDKR